MDIKKTGKKGFNVLAWGFVIFCLGLLGLYIIMQTAQALLGGKDNPVPVAQEAYNAAHYNFCVAHKNLGSAKLNAYFDGFMDASDDEILRWKEAKEQDCAVIIDAFQ